MLDLASRRQAAGKLLTACKFNCTRCIKHQREYTKHYIARYTMWFSLKYGFIVLRREWNGSRNWPFLQIPTGLWQLSVMGSVWLSPPSLRAAWFLSVRCDGLGSPNFLSKQALWDFDQGLKLFKVEKRGKQDTISVDRLKPAYVDPSTIAQRTPKQPSSQEAPNRFDTIIL